MKKKDLEHFEKRLLEEREKLLLDMEHHRKEGGKTQRDASGDLSAYSLHMADMGTDAMEREKSFHFASRDTRLLYHIDRALDRIHKGVYGACEECGNSIVADRLEVVPHARLCSVCKEAEEQKKK